MRPAPFSGLEGSESFTPEAGAMDKPTPEDKQRMKVLLHFEDVRRMLTIIDHLRTIELIRRLPEV